MFGGFGGGGRDNNNCARLADHLVVSVVTYFLSQILILASRVTASTPPTAALLC